jgi:hypothetical protein
MQQVVLMEKLHLSKLAAMYCLQEDDEGKFKQVL